MHICLCASYVAEQKQTCVSFSQNSSMRFYDQLKKNERGMASGPGRPVKQSIDNSLKKNQKDSKEVDW